MSVRSTGTRVSLLAASGEMMPYSFAVCRKPCAFSGSRTPALTLHHRGPSVPAASGKLSRTCADTCQLMTCELISWGRDGVLT